MAHVRIKKGESIDQALRRFNRSRRKSGLVSELNRRKYYEKPSARKKRKSKTARKRKRS